MFQEKFAAKRILLRGCTDDPVQGGEENAPDRIAERDDQDREDRPAGPETRHPEVEHVGNTVLRSAKNEDHHAEKQGEILPKLMRVAFIALNCNINKNIAENTKQEAAKSTKYNFPIFENPSILLV